MLYSALYIPAFIISNLALFLNLFRDARLVARTLIIIVVLPVMIVGGFRFAGPDIKNYSRLYDVGGLDLFDPVFYMLMKIGNFIGLPLEIFLFLIVSLNVLIYWRVSRFFGVDFLIVLAVLFMHLYVARDLSQIRVALAVGLVLYGYTKSTRASFVFYVLAAGTQFSSILLIGALLYYRYLDKKYIVWRDLIVPVSAIFVASGSLTSLTFLDPRIELYMNWNREGYGSPISSYYNLIFFFLLFAGHQYFVVRKKYKLDLFTYSFVLAGAAFIAFSSFSIFSFRLSNILISLYPFSIAMCLKERKQFDRGLYLLFLVTMLSLREGTWKVVNLVKVGFAP